MRKEYTNLLGAKRLCVLIIVVQKNKVVKFLSLRPKFVKSLENRRLLQRHNFKKEKSTYSGSTKIAKNGEKCIKIDVLTDFSSIKCDFDGKITNHSEFSIPKWISAEF